MVIIYKLITYVLIIQITWYIFMYEASTDLKWIKKINSAFLEW